MSNFNLTRIKFTWKGTWGSNTTYKKDDIVLYNGKAYVSNYGHTSSTNFYEDKDPTNIIDGTTYNITVNSDSINGKPSGNFYIDGKESPILVLLKGGTYIFDQSDLTNIEFPEGNSSVNPILFSITNNGTLNGGVTYDNGIEYYIGDTVVTQDEYIENFGLGPKSVKVTLPSTVGNNLYYFSPNNLDMGNIINTRYNSYWSLMADGYSWKGDWAPNTFYAEDNIVKWGGYLYIATTQHTSNSLPGIGVPGNIDNWQLFASGYRYLQNWQSSRIYELGDVVTNNGIVYICIEKHTSSQQVSEGLEKDIEKWEITTLADYWVGEWTEFTDYVKNDVVQYGGIVYRCLEVHTSKGSSFGLEIDQGKWQVLLNGDIYLGEWQANYRYRINDIVKINGILYKAVDYGQSSESFNTDTSKWNVYIPGLSFENSWDQSLNYVQGDIVNYGGYIYVALRPNSNVAPSINGIIQDVGDWELLTQNYKILGDWDVSVNYLTGNVVRANGILYVAVVDNVGIYPDSDNIKWTMVIDGNYFKQEWVLDNEYFLGDIVLWNGTAYLCTGRHLSTENNTPELDLAVWQLFLQGSPSNVLGNFGDIKIYDTDSSIQNLPIGKSGEVLKNVNGATAWESFGIVKNVFYVGMHGTDSPTNGRTEGAPFRTIKYATDFVNDNVNSYNENSTIFVKTGMYEEILPISVPRNCAIVGDELRSTNIQPAAGYETSNMFYVRNGSGIRNLTLQGLSGDLGELNEYLTRRPSAGAFVSLDPGQGPDDEDVWITNKSCYVQNVTTLGTGCIGMKIDGALHSGGNKSIVANDFTQVLSDGIGYWADNLGRSELVSVFTYYCHVGYLCTNGGILRATNGNNSYGEYGSVAEGFDENETPITAQINNYDNEAVVGQLITYGTTEQKILALGYEHAGEQYSNATLTISGAGIGANAVYEEFRNNALSYIRILTPGDSSPAGGLNWTFIRNYAQGGTRYGITLAQADTTEDANLYIGQRIVIGSGKGVGQYGIIAGYNTTTKEAIVTRESDNVNGWDHFCPGWPIENTLNNTSVYFIEPRPIMSSPGFSSTSSFGPNDANGGVWASLQKTNNTLFVFTDGGQQVLPRRVYYSTNGSDWSDIVVALSAAPAAITWTGQNYIIVDYNRIFYQSSNLGSWNENISHITGSNPTPLLTSDGNGNVVSIHGPFGLISNDHGITWTATTIPGAWSGTVAATAAYGNGVHIFINYNTLLYTKDNGSTFSTITIPVTLQAASSVLDITYGNGKFIVVGMVGIDSKYYTGIIFDPADGIELYESDTEFHKVSYGNGVFIAIQNGLSTSVGISTSGYNFPLYDEDSTVYSLDTEAEYLDIEFLNNDFYVVRTGENWQKINTGARAVTRPIIENGRISKLLIYDPGANYIGDPSLNLYDNAYTLDLFYEIYTKSGVLAPPVLRNRGQGYTTATATITGDGFANIYQLGKQIKIVQLTRLPGPGDNLEIEGINDLIYSVVRVDSFSGDGPYDAVLTINPPLDIEESPEHLANITIRQNYSQIRLTGHDFLDIGTGNFNTTGYPGLYLEGETALNARQPFNETVASGGGRVFYTSTDQDGNFRAGELFAVEQATGIVTINAAQFDFTGLTELSLGGIQLGGSTVVIREFSKDSTFVADSNNIVPTQKAIKAYLESRIAGGGSNVLTNTLVSGQIRVTSNRISTDTGFAIQAKPIFRMNFGIDGKYLATMYYGRS